MKKNILIVGASLNSGNKGVNALTRGTIEGILEHMDNPKIKILSYTISEETTHAFKYKNANIRIEELPLRTKYATLLTVFSFLFKKIGGTKILSKIKIFREIIEIIQWADLITDISEGDSFSDIYGIKRYIMHANIKLLAINHNKKLKLLPQTMGPFKNTLVKRITKFICNNASMNYARDMLSFEILENEIGVKPDKIRYCSDLAFYMNPKNTAEAEVIRKKVGDDILVGINVSGLLYNGGYTKNNMFGFITDYKVLTREIIEMFMSKYNNVQVVFIPHVIVSDFPVEDDLKVCNELYNEYKNVFNGRIHLWRENHREDEIKGMLKKCDFVIGGRMHACIGAISSGVPTAPIAYSRKFIGIWEQFGLENFVADPRQHSLEEMKIIIERAFENRFLVDEKIVNTNVRFRRELNDLFSSL